MTRITVRSRPIRRPHPYEYPEGSVRRCTGHRPRKGEKLPLQHPCFVLHATGCVLSVWDGYAIGEARWDARWITQCSAHGTRAWHSTRACAIEAARTASFCRRCRLAALRSTPCKLCLMPFTGCALCGTIPDE